MDNNNSNNNNNSPPMIVENESENAFEEEESFNKREPVLGQSKIKDSIKYNKEKMRHQNKKKGSNNSQSQLVEEPGTHNKWIDKQQ